MKRTESRQRRKNSICALHRAPSELRRSHIVPEFLYKPLYDSKHRLNVLSTGRPPKRHFEQKGIREKLLCDRCEAQFGVYEDYARGVLFGGKEIEVSMANPRGFEFHVDYRKFKLFELSILWRVGVTTTRFFNNIDLGDHAEQLRKILIGEQPGTTDEYGCILIWPVSHRDIVDQLVISMGMTKIEGVPCVRLIMGGICWFYFLSKQAIDPRQSGLFLQEDGSLRIMQGDFGINGYLTNFAKAVYTSNPYFFRKTNDKH
ncbi:MAG: hypothetical protein P9X24_13840 [Candidatus Hatepunaea meridiana]|nr:hypothetical protein [Candidatus Hatepunaea meridiana]